MMPVLKKGGRMLRWSMLPMAAALVLALGSSPADADHKRQKHWNQGHGWGHSQHWKPRHHSRHSYYPRQRYNYYYYQPAPTYYYPPPAYYYPRPRYYNPYGGSFSFGLTVPFD